ncbi:NPCBM/NEW2 domain-containing protein, partial [bacterium]|nr:NPCBM/NEW2 domain-containing protein [bacterium]
QDFGALSRGAFNGGAMLEVFFNGKAMPLARWPNGRGWAKYGKVLDKGSIPRWAEKPDRPGKLLLGGDRFKRWAKAPTIWLHGYWHHDWYDDVLQVAKLDAATGEVAFTTPHTYGLVGGRRYAALDLLEEIDTAGEWHLDRKKNVLYLWPPADPKTATVAVSLLRQSLVVLDQTQHVTLRDVTLEITQDKAVDVRGGTDNLIAGCVIRNTGTSAVSIGPARTRSEGHLSRETGDPLVDGRRNRVAGCDIYEIGTSGIRLVGGDRRTLTPAGHEAVNNDIHHYARRKRTNQPAIGIGGVGNRIAHNRIHDAPHVGVTYGGNDHVLELNEVYRLAWETGDVGAFYSGRNWTYRGNVVRHNFFHHVKAPGKHGSMTVYLDDSHSSTAIVGNVFYQCQRAAFIGGGRDNVVDNNIFVECETAVHLDNRSQGWAHKYQKPGADHRMYGKLKEVGHDQPPWSTRYPKLARILDESPHEPRGNAATRNIAVRCRKWLAVYKGGAKLMTIENNLVTDDDPGFVNMAAMDFRLKKDSVVWEKVAKFQRIPFDKIGLVADEYRRALPVGAPVLSPAEGGFVGSVIVACSPAHSDRRRSDTAIRYTVDGSEPTPKSPLYRSPIELTATTTVRARTFAAGASASDTVEAAYTVIEFGPGKPVYLSDLIAIESSVHGGLKRNTNYLGKGPIRLAGKTYAKGLLLHPEATKSGGRAHVTYALAAGLAKAARFLAVVGVDDAAGKQGSVVFIVEARRAGAWQQVYKSAVLLGGGKPAAIDVDIRGADQIRLVVTDAGDTVHSDHAAWAGVRIE